MSVDAVQTRLELDLVELKQLLGITDPGQDAFLDLALSAAKREADNYMNNPFLEENSDYTVDDTVNWQGNLIRGDLVTEGYYDGPIDPITDDVTLHRLDHTLPELYADPEVQLDIPDDVKLGVVEWVRIMAQRRPANVTEERIGDWQVKFGDAMDAFKAVKATYWQTYRLLPGM